MGICPRCGSSKSLANGVLCPECISTEECRKSSAATVTSDQQTTKPYGWGKVQGVLLILGSFGLLRRDQDVRSPVFSVVLFAFNIALGACILRRNRLILPLMVMATVLMATNVIAATLSRDEMGFVYAFGLVIWAVYGVYYYNRRSEFKRWL